MNYKMYKIYTNTQQVSYLELMEKSKTKTKGSPSFFLIKNRNSSCTMTLHVQSKHSLKVLFRFIQWFIWSCGYKMNMPTIYLKYVRSVLHKRFKLIPFKYKNSRYIWHFLAFILWTFTETNWVPSTIFRVNSKVRFIYNGNPKFVRIKIK